jgi:hypothetical protein
VSKYTTSTSKTAHSSVTAHADGGKTVHHSMETHQSTRPEVASDDVPTLGSLGSPQVTQSSPGVIDDYEPGGNHYDMRDNGNGNSGPEHIARYPRMTQEIGGRDETTGRDRIQLEHDDALIHRR